MTNKSLCSIHGCGNPVRTRGLCNAHYQRWQRHGDPLAGRTMDGEPLRWIENVALKYHKDDCLPWPFSKASNGYGLVWVGWMTSASRAVCERAHGAPPSPDYDAAHSCGKGHLGCVNPKHLSWKTASENQRDMLIHGTHGRGERNSQAKLTEKQVLRIRELAKSLQQFQIAEMFGVSADAVRKIVHRQSWAWLDDIK